MSKILSIPRRKVAKIRPSYGYVIVAAGLILMASHSGMIYSFGVLFKPLAFNFGWNRAVTSSVQSTLMITVGITSTFIAWLANRHGFFKIMLIGAIIAGLGLILSSRVTELWQLYLTYGFITGIGLSGNFSLTSAIVSHWFTKRRGLALGIVLSGTGVGTLILVPVVAQLVESAGWSRTYVILGFIVWATFIPSVFLLRKSPPELNKPEASSEQRDTKEKVPNSPAKSLTLKQAIRTKPMPLLFCTYFLFAFCVQMIMVHLVNYATDIGIAALVAASLIGIIGISSVLGRLAIGALSDRIGANNALILCCIGLAISLVWLPFARELSALYIVAVIFGIGYGGEVPLIPGLTSKFFGLQVVILATIVAGNALGGAVGTWVAGRIFDATQSYNLAFTVGIISATTALVITLMLKKMPGQKLE